jgi:enoyl-CoA hydratase/carnithine racemase
LEVILSSEDYDAETAERYGWVNRTLPAAMLGDFVAALAHRIARFSAAGRTAVKSRVNAIALASPDDFRRDSDLFGEAVQEIPAQTRMKEAMKHGLQTRNAELSLATMLGGLGD